MKLRTTGIAFALSLSIAFALRPTSALADDPPPTITNSIGMRLVRIPAGMFMMGSPRGEEQRDGKEELHEVTITEPFYISAHEVTQSQYQQVMSGLRDFRDRSAFEGDDNPVENVEWINAKLFCERLSSLPQEQAAGRKYRLPTEAEWEYACRAGTSTAFHYGDSLSSQQANFNGNYPAGGAEPGPYLRRTAKVGLYQPNAFGLYDMHGNVAEWCADWYDPEYYYDSPDDDPLGPPLGVVPTGFNNNGNQNYFVVVRGGCWVDDGRACRSAYRFRAMPNTQYRLIGFRVVCNVPSGDEWFNRSEDMMNRLVCVSLLAFAGCSSPSNPTSPVENVEPVQPPVQTMHVTMHVLGMNEQLQILWGDWPNKVKQALVELDGVTAVEDEWERELESDEDLDLLFVSYDPARTTVAEMLETIAAQGFEANVKEEN